MGREGARGHGDMGARAHTRGSEAQMLGGSEDSRVSSMEYRKSQKDMVTGDGHGHREFRSRPFGDRELAPGFRRLKAERLIPERLIPVAVT